MKRLGFAGLLGLLSVSHLSAEQIGEVGVEDLYQKLKKGLDSTSPVKSADDEPAVSFYDPISDSCGVEGCVDIGRDDAASFFALKYSP